jgi:hypothetical protein
VEKTALTRPAVPARISAQAQSKNISQRQPTPKATGFPVGSQFPINHELADLPQLYCLDAWEKDILSPIERTFVHKNNPPEMPMGESRS